MLPMIPIKNETVVYHLHHSVLFRWALLVHDGPIRVPQTFS